MGNRGPGIIKKYNHIYRSYLFTIHEPAICDTHCDLFSNLPFAPCQTQLALESQIQVSLDVTQQSCQLQHFVYGALLCRQCFFDLQQTGYKGIDEGTVSVSGLVGQYCGSTRMCSTRKPAHMFATVGVRRVERIRDTCLAHVRKTIPTICLACRGPGWLIT